MKKHLFIVTVVFLVILLTAPLAIGEPGPHNPDTPPGSLRPPSPVQPPIPEKIRGVSLFYNWTAFWERENENITWKCTPRNEDLQVIKEYPEPDTCKITLDLTASLPATYTITFKIDQSLLEWEVIDNTTIKLQYRYYWIIYNFSDVEDMKLQHSHSTNGKLFVFHIQKQMEEGENLFVDPTLIAGGVQGEYYYQRHVWYTEGRWWLFYSDGSDAYYNSTTDGVTNWEGALMFADVEHTQRIDSYFNGSHFFVATIDYGTGKTYFGLGNPLANGTITFPNGFVKVSDLENQIEPNVSADSDGYPWILSCRDVTNVAVFKNTKLDGTWTTEDGFPVTVGTAGWQGSLMTLNDTAMYVFYALVDPGGSAPLYGKLWNGTGFESEETVTHTNISLGYRYNTLSINSTLYVTYRDETTGNAYFTSKEWDGPWLRKTYTFYSNTNLDGYINRTSAFYPPTTELKNISSSYRPTVGQAWGNVTTITTFYATSSDAELEKADAVWNDVWTATSADEAYLTGDTIALGQERDAGEDYWMARAMVLFDTSSLPDTASITNVVLSLYGKTNSSTTDFNITIQNGQPTYPRDPPVVGDFNKEYYSGNGGYFDTSGFSLTGYNDITLTSDGRSWISSTDTTKLCLRSSREIAEIEPVDDVDEAIAFWASEKGGSYRPKLVVTYNMSTILRGYVSFDTSSLPDSATIETATLSMGLYADNSDTEFNITCYSGQDQWTNEATCAWEDAVTSEGTLLDTTGKSLDTYYSMDIATSSVTKTGKTQFRLVSTREGTEPTGDEYVIFDQGGEDYQSKLVIDTTYTTDLSGVEIVNTPSIIRREDGELWVLWGDSNKKIWMSYYNGEEWFEKRHVATEPVYDGGEACFEVTASAWPNTGLLFYGSLYFDVFNMFEDWYVEITDMEGCGNWVFTEEQYYTFKANYSSLEGYESFDTVKFKFSDGETDIIVTYDYIEDDYSIESGDEKINIKTGTESTSTYRLIVNVEIYFTRKVLDALNIDIYMWANFTDTTVVGWVLPASNEDYFNIYNLGGQGEYTITPNSGAAGLISAGDIFELNTTQNAVIRANVTYRKLQYFHTLFSWHMNETHADLGTDNFADESVMFGVDFCYDDVWYDGWSVKISHESEVVAVDGSPDYIYMIFWVTFYYEGVQIGDSESISGYFEGEGDSGLEQIRFYVDLWFNKINASTTVGARVGTYFVGIGDQTPAWLAWWSTNWGPMYFNGTYATFFHDLEAGLGGDVISCREIELMHVWCQLTGDADHVADWDSDPFHIGDFQEFDFNTAPWEMFGIDTPYFAETKVPEMPSTGGMMGAIWGALNSAWTYIVDALGPGLFDFWLLFVGFMDTLFEFAGWPNGFTTIVIWITGLSVFIGDSFVSLLQWLTIIMQVLQASVVPVTNVFLTIGDMITNTFLSITGMITQLSNAYNDGVLPLTPIIGPIITLIGICIPIYEVARMEKYGFGILFDDLNKVMNMSAFVISIAEIIIKSFLRVVSFIIESIPILE